MIGRDNAIAAINAQIDEYERELVANTNLSLDTRVQLRFEVMGLKRARDILAETHDDRAAVRNHELKSWPEFFDAVRDGSKTFEIRRNDRDYRVGDLLELRRWSPLEERYTGEQLLVRVTYMTDFFQHPTVVVMGVKVIGVANP